MVSNSLDVILLVLYLPPLARFGHLITNKLAARFAAELGLKKRLPLESDDQLADRFEAYIGALWCFRGQQSVISVLAPLFHREIASLDHVGAEKAVRRLATKKTTLPLPSPLIPLSASPVASTKSIAPVKVTKPHAGVAAPTHTLVAGSKAKTPDLAVAIVKVQKSKKTKNTAAASKYCESAVVPFEAHFSADHLPRRSCPALRLVGGCQEALR